VQLNECGETSRDIGYSVTVEGDSFKLVYSSKKLRLESNSARYI